MNREQYKIEGILGQMGSQEIPGDPEHRYELRRALLCSRYFESNCNRRSRWDVLLTYTAPLVAGGVAVGVFALMATSIMSSEILNNSVVDVVVADEFRNNHPEIDSNVNASMFLSNPSEPLVQLADFEEFSTQDNARFVPLATDGAIMVR